MKRTLACILSAMLLMTSAGYAATYTGSGYGMQGPIEVEISVEDGKITEINYLKNKETPSVAVVANERIPAEIIKYQSLGVDNVTGATLASNGIKNAVADAAEKAGLDVKALRKVAVPSTKEEDKVWDTDVLVMGGGGAGFSAAIAARQAGSRVILIEKGSVLGGNTMMAGAAYNAVDPEAQAIMILTKAQKDTLDGYLALDPASPALKFDLYPEWAPVLEELKANINAFYAANEGKTAGVDMPGFDCDALHMWHIYTGGLREMTDGSWIAPKVELARTLAENATKELSWMEEVGLEPSYGAEAMSSGYPGLYTVLGAMWPRTHVFMNGVNRIKQLNKVAQESGIEVYTETRGTELLVDETGKVVGAKAVQANGTNITINVTKGVVLATGGYCANPAMVKKYDKYWGENLSAYTLSTNLGTNQGDGILMAQAVGADVFGMEISQMMPSSSPVKGTLSDGIWADASAQIWIDGNANRFVNEYAERDVLAKSSLALDNGIFYIIYAGSSNVSDPSDMTKGAKMTDMCFGSSIAQMVEGNHIWYGSTLKELAEATQTHAAAGCKPAFTEEALRAIIEKYNGYVAAQKDDDFGKEVLSGAIDLDYIESHDDVGITISPRKSSLHHTMGGIAINTEAEVLDKEGNAIPGLWAAGEVTGGIHAGNRLGGNAIADIFVFGNIAGRNAAK